MDKSERIRLRNEVGSLPAIDDDGLNDDNIAIALLTYFEGCTEKPKDDEVDGDTGWSVWAMEKTDDMLDRIVEHLITERK